MSSLIMTVRIHAIALRETGDAASPVGENVVNVAALWPRAGKDEVLGTTGLVTLRDHADPDTPGDAPPSFAAPVLKEKVEGDVALLVHVLERDASGAFMRLLRRLSSAAVGGVAGGVGGGALRHVFTEAIEEGAVMLGDDPDERLEAIAIAEAPVVLTAGDVEALADSREARLVRVPLVVPRRLEREREKGRLAPLRSNGWVVLDVRVDRG